MKILRPLLLLLLAFPSLLPAQTPVGNEIRVATSSRYGFDHPDVAMSPQGSFVVGWTRQLADDGVVFGRLYAADGSPLTSEFRISKARSDRSRFVRLAMMDDGSFVAAFDRGPRTLAFRRFAADGTPLTGDVVVTRSTVNRIESFEVGTLGDGSFVIAWQVNFDGIIARVFGTRNQPLGPEIVVWSGNPLLPRVAVGPDGSFLVMWSDIQGSSGTGHYVDLRARVFTPDGVPRGESFSVLTRPPQEVGFTGYDTAVDADGNFLVTWFQAPQPFSTFVRRYAPDGTLLSGPSFAGHRPAGKEIAPVPSGGFVSVWNGPTLLSDIVVRRFSSSGSPEGPLVPLVQATQRFKGIPRLAASGTGSFAAVWTWYGPGVSSALSVRWFRAE